MKIGDINEKLYLSRFVENRYLQEILHEDYIYRKSKNSASEEKCDLAEMHLGSR
jgi:hypothetical protein